MPDKGLMTPCSGEGGYMPTTHNPRGDREGRRHGLFIVLAIAVIGLIGALVTIIAQPAAFHHEKTPAAVADRAE